MSGGSSDSSSDSASDDESPFQTPLQNLSETRQQSTDDVSSSDDSSSSSESVNETANHDRLPAKDSASKGDNSRIRSECIKAESASFAFSDTASEGNEPMNPVIDGILSKLESPQKQKANDSSSASIDYTPNKLRLSQFSPLKTPQTEKGKRKESRSSKDSSSEEDMFESPLKKHKHSREATQSLPKEESFKFECPAGFKEVQYSDSSVWQEDIEGKEFWLIKAPLDFDPKIMEGHTPRNMDGALAEGQAKDGDTFTWKAKTVQSQNNRVNDYAVILPSEQSRHPKYAGLFIGEVHISKGYEASQYSIPQVTKVPPQIPSGLKLRYTPFGAGADQSELFRPADTITPGSLKKKKKKKNKDESGLNIETFTLTNIKESILMDVNVPIEESSEPVKKKKKNKKSKVKEEIKQESSSPEVETNELVEMEVDEFRLEIDSGGKKKKKKKDKSEKSDQEKVDYIKIEKDDLNVNLNQGQNVVGEISKKKKSKKDKKNKKEHRV